MGEWKETKWGNIVTLEYGKSLKGYQEKISGYRVYGTNGPIGWHEESLCDEAGVIIGRKGAYRGVHYSPDPFFVIDTAFYLKPKTKIDILWAYYSLLLCDINSMDSGSAIPSTSREDFYNLPVFLPPLPVQKRIASILGTLDDKIELNRRMSATLEQMAQALFRSWFVDFAPVRAQAEGRPTGLPPHIARLFPSEFEESPLGQIPKGWRVGTVGDVAEISRDSIVPGDFAEEIFDHFSIPAFDSGKNPVKDFGVSIQSQKFRVRPDCILVSKLNPRTPRIWIPSCPSEYRQIASTEFLVCHTKEPFGRSYFFCLSCDPIFLQYQESRATGTSNSHQRVRPQDFLAYPTSIPPEQLIKAFEYTIMPLVERLLNIREESRTLSSLRDTLLPKLLSGELEV